MLSLINRRNLLLILDLLGTLVFYLNRRYKKNPWASGSALGKMPVVNSWRKHGESKYAFIIAEILTYLFFYYRKRINKKTKN